MPAFLVYFMCGLHTQVASGSPQPRRSSFESRCCRTTSCAAQKDQGQLFGAISDLPPLVLQRIVVALDPASRLELRKVNKLCKNAVDCVWKLVCVPLDQVKHHGMEQLCTQFPSASCLVLSAPQQSVSLSVLGRRRRCEQLLSVFLDNTIRSPANLIALDLSHSVSSITAATLQLLVEALPALQHLALPAVAGVGSSGQWDVLRLLGQMRQLQSCELDCTYFAVGRHSGRQQSRRSSLHGQFLHHAADAEVLCAQQPLQTAPVLQFQHQQQQMQLTSTHHSPCLGLFLNPEEENTTAVVLQASPAEQYSTSNGSHSRSQAQHTEPLHTHVQQQLMISNNTDLYNTSSSANNQATLNSNSGSAAANSSCKPDGFQQGRSHLQICQLLPLQPQPCRPWANLCNLSQLQQLQLSHPCNFQELFENLRSLTRLQSLGLVRVQRGFSSALFDPGLGAAGGTGSCEQGLVQLKCLQGLTRLELGLEPVCACSGTSPSPSTAPRLITPPHTSTSEHLLPDASHLANPEQAVPIPAVTASSLYRSTAAAGPGPAPAAGWAFSHHSCCWSQLTHLRVLALTGGICLDMPLLAATADCIHLTELRASGLLLEGCAPLAFRGLLELRVLTVTQRFSLGDHSAAALFPALENLSVKDDTMHCPDLSCLKHHPNLSSLAIEAPSTGWQLSSLQLGYLVHMDTLKQLSLASRCWGPQTAQHTAMAPPSLSLPGLKSPCALRSMSGTLQPSNSSHWLPTATLTQVTSLTLAGPANDHTLSQLPTQFPGLVTLQLLGSYYASDWGLKRLCRAPHLESLLLEGCEHVTEYGLEAILRGGSIKVLAVHGCGGVDERACQRIRRACRYSCTNLSWHGTDGLQNLQHLQHHHGKHTSGSSSSVNSSSAASGWATSSIASVDSHNDLSFFDTDGQHCNFGSSNDPSSCTAAEAEAGSGPGSSSSSKGLVGYQCSSGSEFLERCWRQGIASQRSGASTAAAVRSCESSAQSGDNRSPRAGAGIDGCTANHSNYAAVGVSSSCTAVRKGVSSSNEASDSRHDAGVLPAAATAAPCADSRAGVAAAAALDSSHTSSTAVQSAAGYIQPVMTMTAPGRQQVSCTAAAAVARSAVNVSQPASMADICDYGGRVHRSSSSGANSSGGCNVSSCGTAHRSSLTGCAR